MLSLLLSTSCLLDIICPIREIHQKSGVPIREIREKSESRPSAKLNPREIFEFRGRRHPRNLIPAKFNPIKVYSRYYI